MSYNKREWATGNVVGAVDLNRIEDRIANVDVGYSCSEEWVTLTDESVTTINNGDIYGFLSYEDSIEYETIKITFEGTEYTCQRVEGPGLNWHYGDGQSFMLQCSPKGGILFTETAGTYQVKIEVPREVVETSKCFEKAVKSASEPLAVRATTEGGTTTLDKTWQEIYDAFPNVYLVDAYNSKTAVDSVGGTSPNFSVVVGISTYTTLEANGYPSGTIK